MNIRLSALPWLLAIAVLTGCAATLTPPPAPEQPRPAFLLDHGRHSSLVLATRDERLMRYAYGEWRWYAERDTGFGRMLAALLRQTPAALGRRELSGPADSERIRDQILVELNIIYAFDAEAEKVDALLAELDRQFRARLDEMVENPVYGLDFVPHPVPYTWRHNSSHVVAEWLEALDFEIRGNPTFGRWRIDESP